MICFKGQLPEVTPGSPVAVLWRLGTGFPEGRMGCGDQRTLTSWLPGEQTTYLRANGDDPQWNESRRARRRLFFSFHPIPCVWMHDYNELRVLLSRMHAHREEAGGSGHPAAGGVLVSGFCTPAAGLVKLSISGSHIPHLWWGHSAFIHAKHLGQCLAE